MPIPIMGYVAAGSTFLPVAVGCARYRKLERVMRVFTAFSVITCVNVALEFGLGIFKIKNYLLSDIYYLVEVPLMAFIYHLSIAGKVSRRVLKACAVVFVLTWLVDELYFADPNQLNNALAMITSIILLVMSLVTLTGVLKTAMTRLTKEPVFWVLTGTIFYSAGTFVVLGLSNELLKLGMTYFDVAWHINWILYSASMVMFTKGLLCKTRA
jgi:hypothetical protein